MAKKHLLIFLVPTVYYCTHFIILQTGDFKTIINETSENNNNNNNKTTTHTMISNQYYSSSHHQMRTATTINCKRSSILRSKELVEIGSCWPRILVLSDDEQESVERCHRTRQRTRQRKTSSFFKSIDSNPIKVSRRVKHRRVVSCSSPILCSQIAPLSSTATLDLTFISIDQNTSPSCWKPLSSHSTQSSYTVVKTSSLTGRPVNDTSHHLLHDDDRSVGSSGIR
jgi:hypothetical protein